MPLQKVTVPLDFTQGVDTKTDQKLMQGRMRRLDNAAFDEQGTIKQKPGNTQLVSATGTLSATGLNLFASDKTLFAKDSTDLYAYSFAQGALSSIGEHRAIDVARRPVAHGATPSTRPSTVRYSTTHGLTTWLSGSDAHYAVRQDAQDEETYRGSITDGSVQAVVPVAAGSSFCILTHDGSAMAMRHFAPGTPSTFTDVADIVTNVDAQSAMTAVEFNGNIAVLYNTASSLVLMLVSPAGVIVDGPVNVTTGPVDNIHLRALSASRLLLLWSNTDLQSAIYDQNLDVADAVQTLATAVTLVRRMTTLPDGLGSARVFWEDESSSANVIRTAVVDSSGNLTETARYAVFGASLLSEAFSFNGKTCLLLANQEGTSTVYQPSAAVVSYTATADSDDRPVEVVAGLLLGTAGMDAATDARPLPTVRAILGANGATGVVVPAGERGRLAFLGAMDVTSEGVTEFALYPEVIPTATERPALKPAVSGDTLYFPGGALLQSSGGTVEQVGFLSAPSIYQITSVAAGAVADGAYSVCVVAEYVDRSGRLHRSAPSIPVSHTVSGGPKAMVVEVFAPLFKTPWDADVELVVYRTEPGGTTLYRTTAPGGGTSASNPGGFHTITSSPSALDITTAEVLYTTGGYLESAPPPASVYAHVHQERLFLVKATDRTRLAYSKKIVPGYGPEFHETLELSCGPSGGDVVGCASADDKLVILRKQAVQFAAGDGPDDAGLQNTFTTPQVVTTDTGCISAASIIETPDGVMFLGQRGFFLVDRGLRCVWLGEPVRAESLLVTSAILVAERGQVRFSTAAGYELVYDYNYRQWSKFTTPSDIHGMAVLNDTVYRLTEGRTIWTETASTTLDNGNGSSVVATTPWLKLAGVQGFQRIWFVVLLGEAPEGSTDLTIEAAYDYEDDTMEEIASTTLTEAGAFQLRIKPARQKCSSISFRITALNAAGEYGFSLSNMTLDVGAKRGARKLPASQTT